MNKTRWQQIENLYYAALEMPAEQRARFLAENCAGDDELRNEVQSLLASHEQAGSFLGESDFALGLQILSHSPQVFKAKETVGNYTIVKFLGRGGMGEVYQAEDARLGRLVALKVLPFDLASDGERIRRFVQEARAASALNHPNILTIHEIGKSGDWHFIVSEFVEGETLRERLKRAPAPAQSEIREIALQIAAALQAAHKAGIVHRDIKPENIMLREDGLVKVLDFGLAKLLEKRRGETGTRGRGEGDDSLIAASSQLSVSPSLHLTSPGIVMGTFAYMSPEQARGLEVDARSDIWNFGSVLYEMLAGQTPFAGETNSDIIAAILTAEPSLPEKTLTDETGNLWQIVRRALQKNPAERYQSAAEMADHLRRIQTAENSLGEARFYRATDYKSNERTDSKAASTAEDFPRSQTVETKRRRGANKPALVFAAVLALVLAGGYLAYDFLKKSRWMAREPMKINRIFDTGKTVTAAISPDGKYVAHAVADAGKESLWLKHLATNSNVQLVAPKEVDYPAITFSNDGNFIYYVQMNRELYQIPIFGGAPKKILTRVGSAISFSPDGRQFTFLRNLPDGETALVIADADGSNERQIASRKKPEFFVGSAWSPDGKVIASAVGGSGNAGNIVALPVEGGAERIISPQKWRAIWQPVWMADGSGLLAPAISESGNDSQQIWYFPASGGEARQLTNDLHNYGDVSLTADSSTLVTIRFEQRTNIWLLPQGKTEEVRQVSNNVQALYRFIAATPDGRIIYPSQEDSGSGRNIWIMNADGSSAKQLTINTGDNILPCATADGRYIVFASNRGDLKTYHIWRMDMDGGNPVQLTDGDGERGPACSADGKTVFYSSGGPDAGIDKSRLWKVSVDGGEAVRLNDYPTSWKDVSPDGNFVAVRFKPDSASPVKLGIVSALNGQPVKIFDLKENTQIRWKPDGRSITYIKDSDIWEQPLNGEPPAQLTKFPAETIYFFDWLKNGDLICARGYQARDPILISNFR